LYHLIPSPPRQLRQQKAHGQIGNVPELYVRAGAIANGPELAVIDAVTPQFRVA
jgi:hypothetical protein